MRANAQVGGSLREQVRSTAAAIQSAEVSSSNQIVRALLNAIPTLIWLSDQNGDRTYFNERWLHFTGRKLQDELGKGWITGVHPEDSPKLVGLGAVALPHG